MNAASESDGISLFSTYGGGASLVDLSLKDNIIFRLSGNSVFAGLNGSTLWRLPWRLTMLNCRYFGYKF